MAWYIRPAGSAVSSAAVVCEWRLNTQLQIVDADISERPLLGVVNRAAGHTHTERESQVYNNMYFCMSIYPCYAMKQNANTNTNTKKRDQFQAHTVYTAPPLLGQYLAAARIVKHIMLGTLAEAIHSAVGRGRTFWLKHVVALLVLPVHGVLCTLDALGRVGLTVDGSPWTADGVRVGGTGDVADKRCHVHLVGAADGSVDPEPVFVYLC